MSAPGKLPWRCSGNVYSKNDHDIPVFCLEILGEGLLPAAQQLLIRKPETWLLRTQCLNTELSWDNVQARFWEDKIFI
jgi:hypothetical protein